MKFFSPLPFLFVASCLWGQFDIQSNPSLACRWHVGECAGHEHRLFSIESYRPMYLLFANRTNNINVRPFNGKNVVAQPLGYENTEVKFQFSFKSRILKTLIGQRSIFDMYVGFTQSSNYQIYSENVSRPMREVNYEPELIMVVPVRYRIGKMRGSYVMLSVNHQSNGQQGILSRSWDRLILESGIENEHWSLIVRPWMRIRYVPTTDSNPDIQNYLGNGEIILAYRNGRHRVFAEKRHTFSNGLIGRGSIRAGYSYELATGFKLHLQGFHGYGENLIDYNIFQTTYGIGVTFVEWK